MYSYIACRRFVSERERYSERYGRSCYGYKIERYGRSGYGYMDALVTGYIECYGRSGYGERVL